MEVRAAGLNPFDWKIAEGILSPRRPHVFPLVLGLDAAGVVSATGSAVTAFRVGDEVFGDFIHDPIGQGTFARTSIVPEDGVVALRPPEVEAAEAAASPMAGMTALAALDALALTPGARLLIVGASGGVGSFALQFAHAHGLHAIAAAREDRAGRLSRLGADRVFEMERGPLPDQVRAALPDGIDGLLHLIPDAPLFAALAQLVRRGGAAATTTYVADVPSLAEAGVRGVNVSLEPSRELLSRLARELVQGRVKVPLEAKRPLRDGPELLAESRAGTLRGKVVLVP